VPTKEHFFSLFMKGLVDIIPTDLPQKLMGPPLRIKFGADPSASDLHLGHLVLLKKLRLLQEMGHEIIFLIGDFTAMIGDPTGKSETRKPLTAQQTKEFAASYQAQVFKVLDPNTTTVVYNSDWLNKLTAKDMIDITATFTVARMLERDDFEKRYKSEQAIGIHEFLYPLLQGYDSVVLKNDIEMGGTDQKFNLLMGRHLQKEYEMAPQGIFTTPILEGLDGVQKMSKSLGNHIGISESPTDIYGKLMSIPDTLILRYFRLLTDKTDSDIATLESRLKAGENPKFLKEELAVDIVSFLHSQNHALEAKEQFIQVFSKHQIPDEMPDLEVPSGPIRLDDILVSQAILPSKKEAFRLASQKAITLDEVPFESVNQPITFQDGQVLKLGKRRFYRIAIR
jgi:tyrosyl-tRNA synthetase